MSLSLRAAAVLGIFPPPRFFCFAEVRAKNEDVLAPAEKITHYERRAKMIITRALIKATAAKYTAEQLQGLIDGLLVKLEDGRVITSASTGNSSYSAQVIATTPEMIELYAAALDYINGEERNIGAQSVNINFAIWNG